MVSPSPSIVELASVFENLVTNNRCEFAAFALLLAEYVAYFTQEVDLFWGSKVTGASILFLSNRYMSLLSMIIQTVTSIPMSPQSCATLTNVIAAFSVLQYIPWAAFSCLRTYALCEHHRLTVATVVFLLSSVPIGTNFSRYRWLGSTTIPVLSCLPEAAIPEELGKQFTIATRVSLIAADLIVLVVTWRATYYGSKAQASGITRRPSFSYVLRQDGTIYFLVLLVLNTLHLLFVMLSINHESLVPVSYVTIFTEPITALLISRFILDLQEVNRGLVRLHSDLETAPQSSVNFAKIIGPLGSSLVSSHD